MWLLHCRHQYLVPRLLYHRPAHATVTTISVMFLFARYHSMTAPANVYSTAPASCAICLLCLKTKLTALSCALPGGHVVPSVACCQFATPTTPTTAVVYTARSSAGVTPLTPLAKHGTCCWAKTSTACTARFAALHPGVTQVCTPSRYE